MKKKSGHLKQAHRRNIYEVNSDIMPHLLVFGLFEDLGNPDSEAECSAPITLGVCGLIIQHLTVYEIWNVQSVLSVCPGPPANFSLHRVFSHIRYTSTVIFRTILACRQNSPKSRGVTWGFVGEEYLRSDNISDAPFNKTQWGKTCISDNLVDKATFPGPFTNGVLDWRLRANTVLNCENVARSDDLYKGKR